MNLQKPNSEDRGHLVSPAILQVLAFHYISSCFLFLSLNISVILLSHLKIGCSDQDGTTKSFGMVT